MAQVYKIENKRYEFKEIDSAVSTSYLLTEADHNKWIKLKTDDDSIELQLPTNLSEGFRCVIENTGVFTVNYVNAAGTSAATQQDKFTEDQFRTVEVVFNNNVWRLQGYIGRQDLSSLYDVNVNATGIPSDGDALVYDINSNVWKAGKNVPFIPSDPFFLDHIVTDLDHGQVLLFDTTAAPITVTFNLGLEDGLHVRVVNIGTGTLTVATAGTLNAAGSTLSQFQGMDVLHAASDIYYGVIIDGIGGTGGAGGGGGYAAGNYFDTYITTSYTGIFPTTHETTSNSLAIGTQSRSFEDNQIVIGTTSTADGINDIAIGHQADCDGNGQGKIAIGRLSSADDGAAIAIGTSSTAASVSSVAFGHNSNALSPSSIQLGAGSNNESETLNFLNSKIAHTAGINVRRENAENTVTTVHRFAENVTNGGVPQHPTLASIAMSFPNRQLYIGTGAVDTTNSPWQQWVPIGTPPNLDYITGEYSDNSTIENLGAPYYIPNRVSHLWTNQPSGATDNDNKEQWASLEWLTSSDLGTNSNQVKYRRYIANEPYFRKDDGVNGLDINWQDKRFARWAIQTNVNGLSSSTNGPMSVPAADIGAIGSSFEVFDRVLFTNQTNTAENGLYVFGVFDGNFYVFNRPEDLQLGTSIGSEFIQVWGDHAGEGRWAPDSPANAGDPVTFTFTSQPFTPVEGGLYFRAKAPGIYTLNLRLKLQHLTVPSNPDARVVITLRSIYINPAQSDQDLPYDVWRYNLYTKDTQGNDDLHDIRINETIELSRDIFYFTVEFYDTPEILLNSTVQSNHNYSDSYLKITPIQLFEATR